MSTTEQKDYAVIEEYEEWSEYEGSYDRYECGCCECTLTDSLRIGIYGDVIPQRCPYCGRELRWQ